MAPAEEVIKVEKKQRKSKKGLILVVVAVILILFLGIAYFALRTGLLGDLMLSFEDRKKTTSSRRTELEKAPEFMYEVPEIVVNLEEGTAKGRFLSIKFFIGYNNAKLQQTLDKRMPEIRDAVLTVLWQRNSDDIKTAAGKQRLREDVHNTIADLLYEDEIVGIYFWHVMIQ
ncbi:MAG: flagellar basal body-associated FliL family protein [Bacillota bacterium]